MRQPTNPLALLRRRGSSIARALLPVLLVGSLSAFGSCPAMAGETTAASVAHAKQGLGAPVGGHSGDHSTAHLSVHAAEHSSDQSSGMHDGHGACPHCPRSDGDRSGGHVLCAAFDEAATTKHASKVLQLDLKLAPPTEFPGLHAAPPEPIESRRPALYHRVFPPNVPLNLRHCVLII